LSGPLTHHGGRLTDARARFGGEAGEWLDLSTGINPIAWQPDLELRIDWRGLPDPAALADLERTAAIAFGAHPDLCSAVPGSEAGLRALAHLLQLPGRHAPLSYSTHAQAFVGAPAADASVLVLANPNNPDGAVLTRDALLALLDDQERSGGWLLVDEAFVDCQPDWSVAELVSEDRRLIVSRSFGKFFGLAGVRLGFVLAPPALLRRLRHLMGEWPVCAAALAFGRAAYADSAWIERTRVRLPQAAARLDAVLRGHGLAASGHCPLFRLIETPWAQRLFEGLAHRHILTRPFADHPRLLRIGLPADDHDLLRLDAALAATLRDG
jgi:cobalamin biosynthetic protein CobC